MKSPFKFLDAYSATDSAAFFGRSEETAALYDMVMKNRLILVYGQSGTGKTSLIQCGLASKFDTTDWLPIFIRRQNDLNQSLQQQLSRVSGLAASENPLEAIREIYLNFLRPVYLVFDQLEELFILGGAKEQEAFVSQIKTIQESNTPCRILLVIREEYLAHLYSFERLIPTLFDRRLRVEPMGAAKVTEVLRGTFQQFNIGVEAPAEATFSKIIDNISGGKAGIQLPYLQVYLDLLYREDFARTYPGQEQQDGHDWLPVTITQAEIAELGKMDNVLERFLREQQEQLQKELTQSDPNMEADAVKKVLDAFVTEEGTKRPINYAWKGDLLQLDARLSALFQPLTPAMVTNICRGLEKRRLLRFGDAHIELAHDALALIIDGKRSAQQRRLRDALNRVSSAYRENLESGEYLSRRQLNSMEELMPLLTPLLHKDIKAFIQDSEVRADAQEQSELVAERKKRRQARGAALIGFVLAGLAVAGLLVALAQYREAARNAAEARFNYANMLKLEGKYPEALQQLNEIENLKSRVFNLQNTAIGSIRVQWTKVKDLVEQGDSLAHLKDYRAAMERYAAARTTADDAHLKTLEEQAQKDLENLFDEAMRNGRLLMTTRGSLDDARRNFETALRLKPNDVTANRLLKECMARNN